MMSIGFDMDWGTSKDQFVVVEPEGYLHIFTTPGLVIDLPGMELVYAFVHDECQRRQFCRVLLESHIAQRKLGIGGIAESGRLLAHYTSGLQIAVFLHNHTPDELTAGFEAVAASEKAATSGSSRIVARHCNGWELQRHPKTKPGR